MRRISIVAVALILGAGHALAADLPVRPVAPAYYPVPVIYDWGGGYIGINGGYAWDRILLYGTAGGAGVNVQTGLSGLPPQTNPEFGWTVGAGLEWAFAENWTAKVEYLFIDLAQNAVCNHGYSCGYDANAAQLVNANDVVKLNENIIRVGVNFKFGH